MSWEVDSKWRLHDGFTCCDHLIKWNEFPAVSSSRASHHRLEKVAGNSVRVRLPKICNHISEIRRNENLANFNWFRVHIVLLYLAKSSSNRTGFVVITFLELTKMYIYMFSYLPLLLIFRSLMNLKFSRHCTEPINEKISENRNRNRDENSQTAQSYKQLIHGSSGGWSNNSSSDHEVIFNGDSGLITEW